ncbi:MAG: PD-(D/E)XK nuclease family protein [Planctomycetes bacterium]|nr:PD-(D/E)XK nuclease family protein [Planctomycetota bacterium]MCW8137211.1 PD-(D/E)XK nuclease family protein [Planctomycetota bacterium]
MALELYRFDLGADDSGWLLAQVRDALASADPLDHLAVLHLSTPDRRAAQVRAQAHPQGYGVNYPAGSPERVARQLLSEFEPQLALRGDVERDFDFFAALPAVLKQHASNQRPGRPLVNELVKAHRRVAAALPPDARNQPWAQALGQRYEVLGGVLDAYYRTLTEVGCLDYDDAPWHCAGLLAGWPVTPRLLLVDDLDHVSPAREALLRALAAKARRTIVLLRGNRDELPYLQQPHDALQRIVLELGGSVKPTPEAPALPRAALLQAWSSDASAHSDVEIIQPPSPAAEVREAARYVRRALNEGVPASGLCVAAPATGAYAAMIAEAFHASGIPFDAPFETPLTHATPVVAVLDLLVAAADGLERTALLDALASPYLPFGPESRAAHVDKATRKAWVVGGRDLERDWLSALRPELEPADASWLEGVLQLAAPFTRASGKAVELSQHTLDLLDRCGAREIAEADAPRDVDASTRALALHEFTRVLEGMRNEFARIGNPSLRVTDFLRALTEQAAARGVRPPQGRGERVAVLGLRELRGAQFQRVFVLGLTDTDLPLPDDDCMFFPVARQAALSGLAGDALATELCQPIDTARQADYLFAHMLLASDRLVLSMPAQIGDTPCVPALPLARLRRVLGKEEPGPALGEQSPTSTHELAVQAAEALAQAEADSSGRPAPKPLALDASLRTGLRGRILELARGDLTSAPGAHEGMVGELPALGQRFAEAALSPSQMDNYAECPMRFWARYVLGAKPADEPTLDTPPNAIGTLLHDTFFQYALLLRQARGDDAVLADPLARKPVSLLDVAGAEDARATGLALIARAFDIACERNRTRGPFWEGVKRQARAGLPGHGGQGRGLLARFIDHELERAGQGIGLRFAEFDFGKRATPTAEVPDAVPEAVALPVPGGSVLIAGSIDRVDEGPDGLEVVDYKTGGAKTTKQVRDGVAFQLATYLAAVSRLAGSKPRAMHYLLTPLNKPIRNQDVTRAHGKPAYDVARLVEDVLPARLGRMRAAMSGGVFVHLPFAGSGGPCRVCDHARACARRDDVIDARQSREQGNPGAYLPDTELQ